MKFPRVGVRLPRLGSSRLVSEWLVAMLACSIISWLDGGWLESRFSLIPSRVWLGDVWRLGTWVLVEPAPLLLVCTCVAIFKFGSDLSTVWGDRRLQRFVLAVVIGAGALTTIVATLAGMPRIDRVGGWAVIDLLVIAWARQFPTRPLALYGIQLQGPRLVQVTCGIAILFAIAIGPVALAPELAACALAAAYPRAWLRR